MSFNSQNQTKHITAGKENACKIEGKFINYNGMIK